MRIQIVQKVDSLLGILDNLLVQCRILRLVPLPVPKDAIAEVCKDLSRPILNPYATDWNVVLAGIGNVLVNHLGAALDADYGAVDHPLGQLLLAAHAQRQLLIDIGVVVARVNGEAKGLVVGIGIVQLDLVEGRMRQVEHGELVVETVNVEVAIVIWARDNE